MARRAQGLTGAAALQAWMQRYRQVTESAMAQTFAERYGEKWRYNVEEEVWLQWVGTHWARRQTPELLDAMRHFLTDFSKVLHSQMMITGRDVVKWQSRGSVSAVERLCRSLPSFLARSVLFDSDPFLLGTPDGTVDLRDGSMRAADPEDYITVLTPVAPAKKGTRAPRWEKFMNDITNGDKHFQKTLQQYAGICAEGTARDQRILFLYGSGGNGKGVFTRTVAGLLGEHAVNAPRDLLMTNKYSQHATHLIDVVKARMALATEVPDDATWDTALVKDLTGGDVIKVNRMRQDPFPVKPSCSIIISGNMKPTLKGIDEAVRRRFLVATFNFKPPVVVVDLEKEFIAAEGPAILRWIIDGAVEREAEGQLYVAKVVSADTEDYFAEENVMEDFISTYLVRMPAGTEPVWMVKTAEVYAVWKSYCTNSGRPAGARNTFTTAMRASGIEYHRTSDGRFFSSVRLKNLGEL